MRNICGNLTPLDRAMFRAPREVRRRWERAVDRPILLEEIGASDEQIRRAEQEGQRQFERAAVKAMREIRNHARSTHAAAQRRPSGAASRRRSGARGRRVAGRRPAAAGGGGGGDDDDGPPGPELRALPSVALTTSREPDLLQLFTVLPALFDWVAQLERQVQELQGELDVLAQGDPNELIDAEAAGKLLGRTERAIRQAAWRGRAFPPGVVVRKDGRLRFRRGGILSMCEAAPDEAHRRAPAQPDR